MTSRRFPRTRTTSRHQTANHARVPHPPRPGFDVPARFRLLHHAHLVQTSGDSHRLAEALAGKGVIPLT